MSESAFCTIAVPAEGKLEEKRSVFLSAVARAESESEAKAFIFEQRRRHPDARHTVFAYLLRDGTARYSDDAEPQGTAGMPVLEAIRRAGLCNVVLVVTRYFGGILLGAGGLTRAYAGAAALALQAAGVSKYCMFTEYTVTCTYADYPRLSGELERLSARLRDTVFEAEIRLFVGVCAGGEERFLSRVADLTAGRADVCPTGQSMDIAL